MPKDKTKNMTFCMYMVTVSDINPDSKDNKDYGFNTLPEALEKYNHLVKTTRQNIHPISLWCRIDSTEKMW